MTYEYTDHYGTRFEVHRTGATSRVQLGVCGDDTWHMAYADPDDAPAIALAVLEAAGWNDDGPDHDEYDPANVILVNLRDIVQDLAEEKKQAQDRETEDRKAREFRRALFPHAPVKWKDLEDEFKDEHRARYRTARNHFANEFGAKS